MAEFSNRVSIKRKAHGLLLGAILCLLTAVLLVEAIIGVYLGEGIIRPARRPLTQEARNLVSQVALDHGLDLEDVSILADDDIVLRGWFCRPREWTGRCVIVMHGIGDNRCGALSFSRIFLSRGYAVLLPDSRRHGDSGGALATYGVLERTDVSRWVDWLIKSRNVQAVFGFGESLGAAILLQAASQDPRIRAVVAESAFASFREVAYDRLARRLGAGDWLGRFVLHPIIDAGFCYVRLRYDVDLEQASPVRLIGGCRIPILLIHGLSDVNTPPRHSRLIRAANPSGVAVWEVSGAGHTSASSADPAGFEARVTGWLDRMCPDGGRSEHDADSIAAHDTPA